LWSGLFRELCCESADVGQAQLARSFHTFSLNPLLNQFPPRNPAAPPLECL